MMFDHVSVPGHLPPRANWRSGARTVWRIDSPSRRVHTSKAVAPAVAPTAGVLAVSRCRVTHRYLKIAIFTECNAPLSSVSLLLLPNSSPPVLIPPYLFPTPSFSSLIHPSVPQTGQRCTALLLLPRILVYCRTPSTSSRARGA